MNSWESIFTQSPINDGYYDEDDVPHQSWEWPKATWFQARRDSIRERQATGRCQLGTIDGEGSMRHESCNALLSNEPLVRIRAEIMDPAVCYQCAREACDPGLDYELLAKPKASDGKGFFTTAT